MPYAERPGNRVKFLLDGEEIFMALKAGFDSVIAAPALTPNTYVRMSFWLIAARIGLGDHNQFPNVTQSLVAHVRRVLDAGHNVDIIVWYPIATERLAMDEQPTEHDALALAVARADAAARVASPTSGRARVYRERYEGPFGSSQHQKVAIFSVNGQRTVVSGGLNMAVRYFDTVAHDFVVPAAMTTDGRAFRSMWHDTAIEIKGPTTTDYEHEWMRRWRRVIAIADATVATDRLYNHLTAHNVTDQWRLRGAAAVAANTTAQLTLTVGAVPGSFYNVPAKVATTQSFGVTEIPDIQTNLIDLISGAQHRIYMENNQLTDPDVIYALYERIRRRPTLTVVIVTNPSDNGAGYLTRRAWLHMALRHRTCRSITYQRTDFKGTVTGEVTLPRVPGQPTPWRANEYRWNTYSWLEGDAVAIEGNAMRRFMELALEKRFHQITDVAVDFHFYAPLVHTGWSADPTPKPQFRRPLIHSKLAVIDDTLICGSANWTYRSMKYDGEISLFARNQALADHALARLLGHYDTVNAVTLANIGATARASADLIIAERDAAAAAVRAPVVLPAHTGHLILLPLEYRPAEMGAGARLYSRTTAPATGLTGLAENNMPGWQWL